MVAAACDDSPVVAALLASGAAPDIASTGGLTALMVASACGHKGVAAQLCTAGARTAATSAAGTSAEKYALGAGHTELGMILQEEADKERVKAWEASDEGKAELARRAEERGRARVRARGRPRA